MFLFDLPDMSDLPGPSCAINSRVLFLSANGVSQSMQCLVQKSVSEKATY
jgi:hypothetical protein